MEKDGKIVNLNGDEVLPNPVLMNQSEPNEMLYEPLHDLSEDGLEGFATMFEQGTPEYNDDRLVYTESMLLTGGKEMQTQDLNGNFISLEASASPLNLEALPVINRNFQEGRIDGVQLDKLEALSPANRLACERVAVGGYIGMDRIIDEAFRIQTQSGNVDIGGINLEA